MNKLLAILLVCIFCVNGVTAHAAPSKVYTAGRIISDSTEVTSGTCTVRLPYDGGYIKFIAPSAGTYKIKISDVKCMDSRCKLGHRSPGNFEIDGERYKKRKDCMVGVYYGEESVNLIADSDGKVTFSCKAKKGDIIYINQAYGYFTEVQYTLNITKKK